MAAYLDTSALVKIVAKEPESAALRSWLLGEDRILVTSDLARTELMRAVRRTDPSLAPRARRLLDGLIIMTLPTSVYDAAGRLEPVTMRSLDAIHLASALALGDDLDELVTYDDRLAEAARANGVTVVAPGTDT